MSRLEQLLTWLAAEPNDTFLLYAVANEYKSIDAEKSLPYYERLVKDFPTYTATYYHYAEVLVALQQRQTAETIYQEGIRQCQLQQDRKALAELQNAYQNMLIDED
ncbi:MAG: tetratricopeptide repeat protein [Thermoflexibacteraceae bacterium]|jgi:hypothetical protein